MRLKVMTLNIWGYNGDWGRRRKLIVELLRREQPDVVGLQEVCDWRQFNDDGDHQLHQLARLAGYPFTHFQPAYRRPDKSLGQGILSHYPIVAIARLPFPRDLTDPKDTEDRVAVWAQVAMPDGIVEIAVTHLSLSLTARERSVRRLVDWLWRQSDAPKILMGDLNDAPHSPTLRFLLAEATPPFADAWALAHPDEHGFTFPSHAPQHRIDYVLFTPPDAFVVDDIRLVGDTPDADGIYPSDHLGIVATLQVEARRANGR
jgi:beta-glucosidase